MGNVNRLMRTLRLSVPDVQAALEVMRCETGIDGIGADGKER